MVQLIIAASLIFTGILDLVDTYGIFHLERLRNYTERYPSTSIGACSSSSVKPYEDYRMINDETSRQYQYIQNNMKVDWRTGLLVNQRGFIGAAMGYRFGDIGSEYYVELDTGITIPVVKIDEKAPVDAPDGCSATGDTSVIEFVIDEDKAIRYFGSGNGYACNGNFNNYEYLQGNIKDIRKVDQAFFLAMHMRMPRRISAAERISIRYMPMPNSLSNQPEPTMPLSRKAQRRKRLMNSTSAEKAMTAPGFFRIRKTSISAVKAHAVKNRMAGIR